MPSKNTILPKISSDRTPPFSVEVPNYQAVEGETIPRRHPSCIDKLLERPAEDVHTIFDILKRSSQKFGNARALGSRKLIKTHTESKQVKKIVNGVEQMVNKQWTYFELSGYEYMSFYEYERLVLQIGAGLRGLGLKKDDRVHIFAATSSHWLAMAHGATSQSMPIVTAYDTLGEEGLTHSLKATKPIAMFLDPHLLPSLINPIRETNSLKYIIWNSQNEVKQDDIDQLKQAHEYLTILSFEELRKMGEDYPVAPVRPSPEDLCCIMYTSGSTGVPKGVPIKHKAVVAAIAGVSVIVGPHISAEDSLLTYLPLAHILEFVFENSLLFWGATMGYGNPKTLSDSSMRNCKGDIREFRPTILVGVPVIWETLKKAVLLKVNNSSALVRNLFHGALWAKNLMVQYELPGIDFLDTIIFKKVQEATGGRLRFCLNGGGPVAKETQRFISMTITTMINGYGLTETTAMGAITDPYEWTDDAVGSLPGSIEIKLVDYKEAGYHVTNKPNPQGEVWIRGTPVMEGYYENEKETNEAMTKDGWFKTGDIGEWDHNGHLKIIDRKKNLVKTLNGEYIALEKLESIYRASNVVGNICVYADQNRTKPIAIIVPVESALQRIAGTVGIRGADLETLVHNRDIQNIVLKELQQSGRLGGLAGIEIVEGVVLADDEWNPQNGLITSAQKLNRRGILERYKNDVVEVYERND